MDTPHTELAPLNVRILGGLELSCAGQPLPLPASRKTRALFVYLLQIRRPVLRERLCDTFFEIPDDPRAALRWSLTKIRAMLGPHAGSLVADRERVELQAGAIVTDVDTLRAARAGGDLAAAATLALEPPLPALELAGLDGWNAWLAAERAGIDTLRAEILTDASRDAALPPRQRELFEREAAALLGFEPPASDPRPGRMHALLRPPVSGPPRTPANDATAALEQQIHYCTASDGVRIAYATTGEGPPLVKAANWLNHLELDWAGPVWGRLFTQLSLGRSLVRYDERGNGLSDWDVDDLSFDAFVRDLETVVDSLGIERFPLLGISQGCAVSIEYAVRHPHRVSHLILIGGYAAGWRHTADAAEAARREAIITLAEHGWGQDNPVYRQLFSQTFTPSATHEELDWFNQFQRDTASPANAVRFLEAFAEIDVRHRLASVRAPTLVIHARGDQRVPIASGVELASSIPGASLVTLDTDSHIPLSREPATDRIAEAIHAFLRTAAAAPPEAGAVVHRSSRRWGASSGACGA